MGEPQTARYAGQAGIRRLYHYERFKAEYLSATLLDQRIHCSSPTNLNDPWDCKPWFDSRPMDDPETFEEMLRWLHAQAGHELQPDLKKQWEDTLRNDPAKRAEFIAGLSRQNAQLMSERRIYCVTPHPDSTLMWSHYAENHRGFCLEFGTDNPLFCMALEVLYQSDYPVWTPHDFQYQQKRAIEMILTKAQDWHYENEFRLISVWNVNADAGYLRAEGDYFRLPLGALKSVIAGCVSDYDSIKAIVEMHMPDLPVKRAVRVPNHYRLKIEG